MHPGVLRAVTHLDVADDDIERAIELIPSALGALAQRLTDSRASLREAQAKHRLPSLSAAVARQGETVWAEAVGLADAEARREATPDTQYRVGSITKTFTAAAIMQLRDEGKLDLDDPLGAARPRGRARRADAPPAARRTLRASSASRRARSGSRSSAPPRGELLGGSPRPSRCSPPGDAWHYSNLAYALLGEVVARIAGGRSTTTSSERLLRAARPRARRRGRRGAARRCGYLVDPYSDAVRREAVLELGGMAAAGQLWSTTGDLAPLGRLPRRPRSRRARARRPSSRCTTCRSWPSRERWPLGWGLGLMLFRRGERVFGGHGGAMPGFLSELV